LFGAASAWAAVTVKEWLQDNNIEGIIRFYGTPAGGRRFRQGIHGKRRLV
jgi:hypothetical protein